MLELPEFKLVELCKTDENSELNSDSSCLLDEGKLLEVKAYSEPAAVDELDGENAIPVEDVGLADGV